MWSLCGHWAEQYKEAKREFRHSKHLERLLEQQVEDMKDGFRWDNWQSYTLWFKVRAIPAYYSVRHFVRVMCLLEDKDNHITDSSNDRMATAYYVPLVHCADHKMMKAYVSACDKLKRNNIFKAPIVVVAMRYAWKKYGRKFHLVLLYRFMWFLFVFGMSCVGFGSSGNGRTHNGQFMLYGYAPQFILFMVNLSYLRDECKLILSTRPSLFLGVIPHITSNVWNAINCFLYLAICFGTGFRILLVRESDMSRICMACASILLAAKLLYFFRAFETTGRLISYLVKILKGIFYFLIVLALVVFGFAFAFWIVANEAPTSSFYHLDDSLVTTFAYMMGQFDSSDFDDISVNQFARYMYVLYMIVTTIILLNLLIAIMGDIYSSVEKNAMAQFRWEQCNVIIANMFNIEKKTQAKRFNEPLTVNVLKVRNPLDDINTTPTDEELGAEVEPDFEASSADSKTPEQERAELLQAISGLIKEQQAELKVQVTRDIAEMLRRSSASVAAIGSQLQMRDSILGMTLPEEPEVSPSPERSQSSFD
jgi:hypothetical protein